MRQHIEQVGRMLRNPKTFTQGVSFDVWSLVHALIGITSGVFFFLFGVPLGAALVAAATVAALFEAFEMFRDIKETIQNRIADIFLGIAATLLGYLVIAHYIPSDFLRMLLVTVLLMSIGTVGYYAWKYTRA